jgi:hypothetical protein
MDDPLRLFILSGVILVVIGLIAVWWSRHIP